MANNETKQQKIHWLILSPFISVSMILDFAGIQMLHLNKQVEEWLKAQVNKINSEIDEWLRTQAEFIRIYKDIEESSLIKEQSIEETKTSTFDIPKRQRKNVYNKYVKGFDKSIVKRPERIFSESDRSFKSDRLIQKVEISCIDDWNLKFDNDNEAEINQILYFGYKDSLFYDKVKNVWLNNRCTKESKIDSKINNQFYANWTP